MKKYLILAASALALAGCSSDEYLGGENPGNENGGSKAINFAGAMGKTTRADHVGADAATLLGNKFYVLGTKGTLPKENPTETIVFDNYQVNWSENTAGTTDDNTNDWAYIGVGPTGLHAGKEQIKEQSIKYWDYSQPQYDFIAYSIGGNTLATSDDVVSKKINGSAIVTPKSSNDPAYASYTLKANSIDDFAKCYFTDVTPVVKENYGKPVQLTFKNLTAKVRVAFYEIIPGYTVSNLQFYTDKATAISSTISNSTATLYTTGDNDNIATNGDITVTYPVVGSDNSKKSGYNKAFVSVATNGTSDKKTLELGSVNYVKTSNILATSAKTACMAGKEENGYYTAVLPTSGNGTPLTIRMNYTLTSEDGSGETINVYGASAVIPAAYTQWQPNYAYTYIFKISDNTNGFTSTDTSKEGLFPITFDAVVADTYEADFNQETVTTVSTPSVTTYAFNSTTNKVVQAYGESAKETYPAGSDIYFSVTKDGTLLSLAGDNPKGQLYMLSGTNVDKNSVTEAEVIDALQVVASSDDQSQSITGRNGLKLTKTDTKTDITAIPTEYGKDITVDAGHVAKLADATAGTYAYVYDATEGKPETTYIFTAVKANGTEIAGDDEYYLTPAEGAASIANGQKLTAGQIYYKRYTNNNKTFGVKVVKIAAAGN